MGNAHAGAIAMSDETRHAFEHPEVRAAATAGGAPYDRISLRDHQVKVEIGAFQAERGTTQTVSFNIVVEVVPLTGPVDDDVDRILSYDRITESIAYELAAERLNLLETLAERVAERILLEPQARRVFVRIEKLDRGPGALGVEIVRARSDAPTEAAPDAKVPHPVIAFISNAVMVPERLTQAIDSLVSKGRPLILCVEHAAYTLPQSASETAQRRIDLLALEQQAWVLAGLDTRCAVVETRTELDWAMKNGQVCVWAPSKMVLDAVAGPEVTPREPLALATWFAAQMQAAELVTIGVTPPKTRLPTREIQLGATA